MGIEPGERVLDWDGSPKGLGQEGPQVLLPSWWESVPTLASMPVLGKCPGVVKQPLSRHRRELLPGRSHESLLPTVLSCPDFPAVGNSPALAGRQRALTE